MKNSYTFYRRLLGLAAFCAAGISGAQAQLTVTPVQGNNATQAAQLAQALVGQGITITNAALFGWPQTAGFFNGSNSNIGLGQGILLTNGSIHNAVGPNNMGGATIADFGPGLPILNVLVPGQNTVSGTMLEFDVEVASTGLFFQYVFASEEYPEWACLGFNDVFGFFISGPGIIGNMGAAFPGVRNIAQLPGTSTAVTIDNINDVAGCAPPENVQYYVNNGTGLTPAANTTVQYDGFTTALLCEVFNLTPGEVYHLQIAVADVTDDSYDSGVFLGAGSLRSCLTPDCNPLSAEAANSPAGISTRLFPNPATEEAVLQLAGLPEQVSEVSVLITDMLGREVGLASQAVENNLEATVVIPVGGLPAGMYQLLVHSQGGQPLSTCKFIVSK